MKPTRTPLKVFKNEKSHSWCKDEVEENESEERTMTRIVSSLGLSRSNCMLNTCVATMSSE